MSRILNISAYRFVPIDDTLGLRDRLHERAQTLGLRGTVLLAEEGINLFLAGPETGVRDFVALLRADPRFADLTPKVKPEIIRMNHPAIRPAAGRAPAVDALTVRRWLAQGMDDEGRPVVTLDTRNAFEVDYGTFAGALDWRLQKFSDFPEAVQAHRAELEGRTVVSFCTGGIRCEKAAIYLQEAGLQHVYQLEGGILKYFEEAGGEHYRGECFVFDEREALGHALGARRP